MDQGSLTCPKRETVFTSVTHPSYATEECLAPPVASPSSWFPGGKKRGALLWGITSTVLSAIGLIGLALFEQYNGMLSELRGDLKHFNETSSEYVKKDTLQRFWERMRECSKENSASSMAREQMERELNASESGRADLMKEMQRLRERLAYLEGMRAARPSVDSTSPSHLSFQAEERIRPRAAGVPLSTTHSP